MSAGAPDPAHARMPNTLADQVRFGDLVRLGDGRPMRVALRPPASVWNGLVVVDEAWPQARFIQVVTGVDAEAFEWRIRPGGRRGRLLALLQWPIAGVAYLLHVTASLLQIPVTAVLTALSHVTPRKRLLGTLAVEEVLLYGVSMWPHLREGWVLSVAPARLRDLRLGDIVLVRVGPAVVAHRLVAKLRWAGRTVGLEKGDAILSMSLFGDDQLVGRVVAADRLGGTPPQLYPRGVARLAAAVFLLLGVAWSPIGLTIQAVGATLAWAAWMALGRPSSSFSSEGDPAGDVDRNRRPREETSHVRA